MRITEYEKNVIIEAVNSIDPDARVWLFGSRADDSKKGGDIDIGILSSKIGVMEEISVRQKICDNIGEQKIDLVVSKDGQQAFLRIPLPEEFYCMDKGSIEILKENLFAVNLSLKRLVYSYEICKKIGIKNTYTDEEFVAFEAMTSRYARTTDMLINKVLRSLDTVEYIQAGQLLMQ